MVALKYHSRTSKVVLLHQKQHMILAHFKWCRIRAKNKTVLTFPKPNSDS